MTASAHATHTILIIDDMAANLSVVMDALEDHACRIVTAQDGEEGLQRAELVHPDLILLDVMMPGLDGFEVCRRLKAQPHTREIPVIIMTSLGEIEDKVAGFQAGAVDYITKPLQIDEVVLRVNTHLKLRAMQRLLEQQNVQLQAYGEELERKVAERTAELELSNRRLREEIEERKRAEKLLQTSERQFRRLAENSPDIIVRYDRQCRRVYVNPEYERANGLSASAIIGKTPLELSTHIAPVAPLFQKKIEEVLETGMASEFDLDWRMPNGSRYCYSILAVPEFDEAGEVESVLTLAREITARIEAEELLHERAQEFQTLVENAPDVIVRYDRDCRRVYVNPAYLKINGVEAEDILGKTPTDFSPVHKLRAREFQAKLKQVLATGTPTETDLIWETADGESMWYMARLVPEFDRTGKVCSALSVAREITELKRMEASLRQSEQRYREISDNVSDMLYLLEVDSDGKLRYLEVNPAFERLMGRPREHIVGRYAGEISSGEVGRRVLAKYQRCLEAGHILDEEIELPFPSGTRIFHSTLVPVQDASGAIYRITGISRDITERKQIEAMRHAHEQEFHALVENSPDTVVRYDPNCRRIYANPAFEKLCGFPAKAAMGEQPVERSVLGKSAAAYQKMLKRVVETGQPDEMLIEIQPPTGGTLYHQVRAAPEFDPNGKVASVLAVGWDITKLKETERYLEESRSKLRELVSHREAVREEERKHISRELHDELGQRLTALRMDVALLRLRFGKEHPQLLEHVQNMLAFIDATIQVVRSVAASLRPAALDMGIASALEWLAEEFTRRTGVACKLNISEQDIRFDEHQATVVFRLVQESLTNVARHAEAQNVVIDLKRENHHYLLQIKDNGKGFDPEVRNKKKSFGLMGMRERVLMLDGSMTIEAAPGSGVLIAVRIPEHTDKNYSRREN